MEFQEPIIKFYQKRSFGEKMSASFDFLKKNIKLLLKLSVYLLLPLSLIQAIFMNTYLGSVMSFSMAAGAGIGGTDTMGFLGPMLGNIVALAITGILATSALIALIFTCMQVYNEKGSLKGVTFSDLKDRIIHNALRALVISLIIAGIVILFYALVIVLAIATPFTALLTVPAFVAFVIPIVLIYPIYLFEQAPVGTAISKAYKLGMKTWGSLFGLLFVMGMLAGILQGVAMLPWYILVIVKTILTINEPTNAITTSFGYSLLQYLTAVVMLFFTYIAMMFVYLGVAYHYSSASEATEATSVSDDLQNFEQLKD